jgi:hypothetical protein
MEIFYVQIVSASKFSACSDEYIQYCTFQNICIYFAYLQPSIRMLFCLIKSLFTGMVAEKFNTDLTIGQTYYFFLTIASLFDACCMKC